MGLAKDYTKEEDEIILYYLRGCSGAYGEVHDRCELISTYLRGRTAENIRKHYYQQLSKPPRRKIVAPPPDKIKNVSDLLSPAQRKRVRIQLPNFKTTFDPRMIRKP